MLINCPICNQDKDLATGAVNRARKQGKPIYCGRICAGIARRDNKTKEEKIEAKKLYDMEYRIKNLSMLKSKKAKYYAENHDREKEREKRKLGMHRHVEYCRQPEYKQKKKVFDRQYRAKKYHAEFWESLLILQDLEKEIESRMSKQDIRTLNGTLNKHKQRRREYERLISNKS